MSVDPVAGIPDTIKIGWATFQVIVDTKHCADEQTEGMSSGPETTIYVRADRSLASTQEVLLHEVLHACVYTAGLETATLVRRGDDGHAVEERLVRAQAGQFLQTLRENPRLVEFLRRES